MTTPLTGLAQAIEGTAFATWATGSALAYPIANTVHVVGAILLVGAIGVVDLRLLGLMRTSPLRTLSRTLTPIAIFGLLLMFASGAVLFAADASALSTSRLFLIKLGLVVLAVANAVGYQIAFRHLADPAPSSVRLMALASLVLWFSVVVAGRWIAYA